MFVSLLLRAAGEPGVWVRPRSDGVTFRNNLSVNCIRKWSIAMKNYFIIFRTRLAKAKAAPPSVIGEIAQKVS